MITINAELLVNRAFRSQTHQSNPITISLPSGHSWVCASATENWYQESCSLSIDRWWDSSYLPLEVLISSISTAKYRKGYAKNRAHVANPGIFQFVQTLPLMLCDRRWAYFQTDWLAGPLKTLIGSPSRSDYHKRSDNTVRLNYSSMLISNESQIRSHPICFQIDRKQCIQG